MFITTLSQLQQFCDQIKDAKVIAVDTEFKRESTYYPQLCLVQIAALNQFAIIDALAIDNLEPLNILLQNPSMLKVMHSCSQDLEIFYQEFDELPKNIFDTQIAACVVGCRSQISFKDLVLKYLNIEIDKSETRSNWTKRPLSNKQLTYAQHDVDYLLQCYPQLLQELKTLKRLHWLSEDFTQLENTNKFKVDTQTLWKKVRGHQNLKNQQLTLLNQLAIWRENIAMQQDLIRRKVITDDCLISATKARVPALYNQQCLADWLNTTSHLNALQRIINSQAVCQIINYQPYKLDDKEKVLFNHIETLISTKGEQLSLDLKSFISNSKLKKLIKNRAKTSPPCLNITNNYWLRHAVYQDIFDFLNEPNMLY